MLLETLSKTYGLTSRNNSRKQTSSSCSGKQWKITENENVRRVQDGQFSEMIVHFKFGQRKWEKEKVTKMKDDELRAVIDMCS